MPPTLSSAYKVPPVEPGTVPLSIRLFHRTHETQGYKPKRNCRYNPEMTPKADSLRFRSSAASLRARHSGLRSWMYATEPTIRQHEPPDDISCAFKQSDSSGLVYVADAVSNYDLE